MDNLFRTTDIRVRRTTFSQFAPRGTGIGKSNFSRARKRLRPGRHDSFARTYAHRYTLRTHKLSRSGQRFPSPPLLVAAAPPATDAAADTVTRYKFYY
jgi:hypothetical protein